MTEKIYAKKLNLSFAGVFGSAFGTTLVSLLFLYSTASTAQSGNNVQADWPCIQAYVPEVALAVVWPEPVDEDLAKLWKKDKALKKVVRDFGNLEVFEEADRKRLEQFAESVPEADRAVIVNAVAAGIATQFNTRRKDYFRGIRKFTRQQIDVAQQIESRLNELVELADKTDDASVNRRKELEETGAWQQRIFDKRERSIGLLCDLPVELESRMGEVLRELALYLP